MAVITVLGFDFGLRRIGVAVGQSLTQTASPLPNLIAQDGMPHWPDIDKLIQVWKPHTLLVGIPLQMNGEKQEITRAAENFSLQLQERYSIPVQGVDERLSTIAAREKMFAGGGFKALKKGKIDSVAAVVIVEAWLQQNNRPL
jgi:putative Holliday junction resolvase